MVERRRDDLEFVQAQMTRQASTLVSNHLLVLVHKVLNKLSTKSGRSTLPSVLGYTQDQLAEATKKLAEQEPYVQLMRALIRPWEPGSTYNYGDIVQLNGMTYQAEANDVRLIAPDKVDNTAVGVVWRPLVRIAPAKTLPDPEEPPVVMPSPDMPIDGSIR